MGAVLAGIDLGTSGAKAGLYNERGVLLGFGRARGYRQVSSRPDWAEVDPEAWWSSVREALSLACADAEVEPARIDALGTCVIFPAVVVMDEDGAPLRPAMLYSDRRSVAESEVLEASLGPGVYRRRSGNVASPGTCAATSILWLRRHEPEVLDRCHMVGFASTFLTHRLTGEWATDFTQTGLSGLVDIRSPDRWDRPICEIVGLELEKLPRIAPASAVAGGVSAPAAAQTGLRVGTPVVTGMGDAPCAAFGAGVIRPGSVGYVAGSTDCVTVPLEAPLGDHRWLTMGFLGVGQWLGIGTLTSAGTSVEWFADRFYPAEGEGRVAAMAAEAQTATAGGSLLYLPYLQGERTPHWDPRARAQFSGLSLATTRAEMARAVFVGTALALRDVVDCLPRRPTEVRAFGGAMANRLWTQLKADALDLPLTVLSVPETGALGAAMLAGCAVGCIGSVEEAAGAVRKVTPSVVVEPMRESAVRLSELLPRYREIYLRDRGLMHALSEEGSA